MLLENINRLCSENNITIAELEKKLGIGNATIRKWGNSKASLINVMKVANYFGVTIDSLISEVNKNELTSDGLKIAKKYEELNQEQKGLVRVYISMVSKGGY